MRLSLKKAAYVAVDWCGVVGNPESASNDKKGASSAVVSHSSSKTGLEWGTQRLLVIPGHASSRLFPIESVDILSADVFE